MKKSDAHPPKFFSSANFGDAPRVFTVECVRMEEFENDNKKTSKPVAYFRGERSGFVLSPMKWDQVVDALDEAESDNWVDRVIELFPDTTFFGGKRVATVSARRATSLPVKAAKKPKAA